MDSHNMNVFVNNAFKYLRVYTVHLPMIFYLNPSDAPDQPIEWCLLQG